MFCNFPAPFPPGLQNVAFSYTSGRPGRRGPGSATAEGSKTLRLCTQLERAEKAVSGTKTSKTLRLCTQLNVRRWSQNGAGAPRFY